MYIILLKNEFVKYYVNKFCRFMEIVYVQVLFQKVRILKLTKENFALDKIGMPPYNVHAGARGI